MITITIKGNFNEHFFFRIGNNVILMDDTGGLTCFKCFNLVLRSSNVLQIHTSALDKCYTTEERAVADCPSDITIREKRAREIMLYSKFLLIHFHSRVHSLMTSHIIGDVIYVRTIAMSQLL